MNFLAPKLKIYVITDIESDLSHHLINSVISTFINCFFDIR